MIDISRYNAKHNYELLLLTTIQTVVGDGNCDRYSIHCHPGTSFIDNYTDLSEGLKSTWKTCR